MMPSDLLERMRRNPAGDWTIQDVETLCREHGLLFVPEKAHRTAMPNTPRHGTS